MLARLLAISRPATASAFASQAAGLEAALALSSQLQAVTPSLLRDGGLDASTSYSAFGQVTVDRSRMCPCPSLNQRRSYATATSTASAASALSSPTAAAAPPSSGPDADPLSELDMESLMTVLLHPLPLGRVRNPALYSGSAAPVVQLGPEALFFDPAHTLSSTMRALHVVRQVLRADGHVLVVNPNPAMRPLMREAAHLCLNRNVWFWHRDWQPGVLSDPKRGVASVLNPHNCQPNRRLMAERGLALRNPLCLDGSPAHQRVTPAPVLSAGDTQRLLAGMRAAPGQQRGMRERRREYRKALEALMAAHTAESRLLPAGTPPAVGQRGRQPQLALLVSLDLSYGGEAVREAYERNVQTVSLLNGHSDASNVTYPVYAAESHLRFQHFFLEWLLRVVNLPPPKAGKEQK